MGRSLRRAGFIGVIGTVCTAAVALGLSIDGRDLGGDTRLESLRTCPWLDASTPVAQRVEQLLKAMTPAEEASLLHLHQIDRTVPYEGYSAPIPRLCIPLITEQDGAAGTATGQRHVTQLPAPIADAAAFDPALAGQYGSVIGSEDATKGVDMALAPTVNIDRSPLWGRSYETLGEDPYLAARLAAPLVKGIQTNRVVAVVKHLAVYNQEAHRATLQDDSIVSDQALHEVYLPAFAAAVEAGGAGAVMCSYNLINGTPACENGPLIDGVLRNAWHFDGFVRSDCDSVYHQAPAEAVGVSQVKCSALYNPAALAKQRKATLDALARPLLTVLFRYNLIAAAHPLDPDQPATTAAHRAVALSTANESAVLLKNSGLLPLDLSKLSSLALIGPSGGTPMPVGFGAIEVFPTDPVNALTALREAMGSRVSYSDGSNIAAAAAMARRSSVAVVVVHDVEAERRDRTSLALPGQQDALVAAVAAANPHTVVVLETGSAVLMPWLDAVPAVLETWYPGETAGTSLVGLLSGRVDPSGKLPVTFPATPVGFPTATPATFGGVAGRTDYAEGVNVGYRWFEGNPVQPAFPFGFGLSYTTFGFSHLTVAPSGGGVTVTATVTNTGRYPGADVVQAYVGSPAPGEPARQLRGFRRVDLAAGRSQVVTMVMSAADLAAWDSSVGRFVVAPGSYKIWVGDSSSPAGLPLSTSVTLATSVLPASASPGLPAS